MPVPRGTTPYRRALGPAQHGAQRDDSDRNDNTLAQGPAARVPTNKTGLEAHSVCFGLDHKIKCIRSGIGHRVGVLLPPT